MFAVPGWKLSADSLVSEEPGRSIPEKPGTAQDAPNTATSKSKKRKLGQPEERLSAQDLDSLWNEHFGSSTGTTTNSPSLKSKDKKARKKNTVEAVQTTDKHADAAETQTDPTVIKAHTGSPVEEKPGKQKHRKLSSKLAGEPLNILSKKGSVNSSKVDNRNSNPQANGGHASNSTSAKSDPTTAVQAMLPPHPPPPPLSAALTPLQAKMRNKLTSARFRHLNQTLYTSSSSDALQLFSASPELFAEYHAGFSQQVKDSWPQNPVDIYIREIKERGAMQDQNGKGRLPAKLPLPRRKTGRCTIADLGCGDAPLARGSQSQVKALQLKFHNYDLHAPNSFVTKADIAKLPLRDGEADIAVFCLSLMGTNWLSFVEEAWRVLRGDGRGEVWVAEVKSRFGRTKPKVVENSVGNKKKTKKPKKDKLKAGDEDEIINGEELFAEDERLADEAADDTDISAFVGAFQRRGFVLREGSVNRSNKMFITMVFTKYGIPIAGKHKGLRWNGNEYERSSGKHSGRMKFLEDQAGEEITPEDEGKILKPTLYKTR